MTQAAVQSTTHLTMHFGLSTARIGIKSGGKSKVRVRPYIEPQVYSVKC
jgi:hypothetical protein